VYVQPPSYDRKATNVKLLYQFPQPLIVGPKPNVPVARLAIDKRFRNSLTDVILHESDDAVPFPAENAEGESDVRDHRRPLGDVRH